MKTLNKLGSLIIASPSPRMTNHFLKGAWSLVRSCEPFKFWWALTISLERLKLEWSNFVHRWTMSYPSLWLTNHP